MEEQLSYLSERSKMRRAPLVKAVKKMGYLYFVQDLLLLPSYRHVLLIRHATEKRTLSCSCTIYIYIYIYIYICCVKVVIMLFKPLRS